MMDEPIPHLNDEHVEIYFSADSVLSDEALLKRRVLRSHNTVQTLSTLCKEKRGFYSQYIDSVIQGRYLL